MQTNPTPKPSAFSLVELVIVIAILAIIAAIAVPRFADAGSGRRLAAAQRTILNDIELVKLRARAQSKTHLIKFYPDENKYFIIEGTDADRNSVVMTRDLDDDPFNLELSHLTLTGDQIAVISAYGEISPDFSIFVLDNNTEIEIIVKGVSDPGVTPTVSLSAGEVASLRLSPSDLSTSEVSGTAEAGIPASAARASAQGNSN